MKCNMDAEIFTSNFSLDARNSSLWGGKTQSESWSPISLYKTNMSNVFGNADFGMNDLQVKKVRFSYVYNGWCPSSRSWAPYWLS